MEDCLPVLLRAFVYVFIGLEVMNWQRSKRQKAKLERNARKTGP